MEYIEFIATISPLEVGRDILIAELSEIGFESFVETEEGLEAYIQSKEFNEENIKSIKILQHDDFTISYSLKSIAEQNWNAEWEKSFNPINVDNRCYIRAPFHNKLDNIEYDIIIDPKMSFGTGHHETTYLMLKRLLNIEVEGKKVLDMGCGTGVLAILAKMRNSLFVKAIDIDEWAYNNSLENIRNNNCDDIKVERGGAEVIGSEKFDIIIANINRNILLKDMNLYINAMSVNGELLLSGFFSSDQDILLDAADKMGLKMLYKEVRNEWMMLHLIK
jgi:ribosomal protein L11 methyltransferase